MDASELKANGSYRILLNGEIRKAYVMYILDSFYQGERLIVFRYYGKYKQWWHQELLSEENFTHAIELAKKKQTIKL